MASDQDGKFFTGVQVNNADKITWKELALKSDFVKYTITGTTDGYGQIYNPKNDYIPIASVSIYEAIFSSKNVIRVVSISSGDITLVRNTEVNIDVIAIKASALSNV